MMKKIFCTFARYKKKMAALMLFAAIASGCAITDYEKELIETDSRPISTTAGSKADVEPVTEEIKTVMVDLTPAPVALEATRQQFSCVTNWRVMFAEDDDAVYVCASKYNDDNTGSDYFVKRVANGEETTLALPEIPKESTVDKMYLSGHNLYILVVKYDMTDGSSSNVIFAYTDRGEFLYHKSLEEITGVNNGVYSLFPDRYGGLWLVSPYNGMLYQIGQDGNITRQVEIPAGYAGVFLSGRGKDSLLAFSVIDNGFTVGTMNTATNVSETYMFDGISGIQRVFSGEYSDLLVMNDTCLYKIVLGNDAKLEKVLVFTDYGINPSEIQTVGDIDGGGYVVATKKFSSENVDRIVLMPSTKKEKQEVTLACLQCPEYLKFAVSKYNESSSDVKISIKTYFDKYAIDSTMEEVLNKFNSDLMDGTAGDIVCLDGTDGVGDRDTYLNRGLFLDLYGLMEKDEEFDKNDYFTNVWKVNETDGKLYTMVPVFSLNTKYALESDVGDVNHLDEDVLFSADDPGALYGPEYNQDMFLHDLCVFSLGDVSDADATMYDEGQLEKYFEFSAGLLDYDAYDDAGEITDEYLDNTINVVSDYYDNRIRFVGDKLRTQDYLYDIRYASVMLSHSFTLSEDWYADPEDMHTDVKIVAAGFPTREGCGTAITNGLELAVPVYAEQVEVAWDFLKYMLSPEFQQFEECRRYGLPVNRNVYAEMTEKLMAYNSLEDDDYYMGGESSQYGDTGKYVSFEVPRTTQWMVDEIAEAIEKADYLDKTDANVEAILKEELNEYVQGRKTAAEAAKSAVSRIRIYADEKK